jgi:hypothetical protein
LLNVFSVVATIILKNSNEPPVFSESSAEFSIPSNSGFNASLGSAHLAYDPEQGGVENQVVTYRVKAVTCQSSCSDLALGLANLTDIFAIDASTARLHIALEGNGSPVYDVDRCNRTVTVNENPYITLDSVFQIEIEARDSGFVGGTQVGQQFATKLVTVTSSTENTPPVLCDENLTLPEDAKPSDFIDVKQLVAWDRDSDDSSLLYVCLEL